MAARGSVHVQWPGGSARVSVLCSGRTTMMRVAWQEQEHGCAVARHDKVFFLQL